MPHAESGQNNEQPKSLIDKTVNAQYSTVDPQLSGPQVSDLSDFLDWVVTVQLECFVKSVCFIRVFEWSFANKSMGLQLSKHTQGSMSSDK